ncbi:transposable element Tc1 transposase [Trichonephila clavipes]|nr:transposable element Tc1 transposase [Trichonephila clavipes]
MGIYKCIVPLWHGGTLNSCPVVSLLEKLVIEEERWKAPDPPPGGSLSKLGWYRAKSCCHLCGAQGKGQRLSSPLPGSDAVEIMWHKRTTAQQVANQFLAASRKIFRKTVARRLRGGELYARRPVVCVPLTRQHRTARLQWCREHHNWTEHDWAGVLFSDETKGPISDIQYHGVGRHHDQWPHASTCAANGAKTGQRYIDEVLFSHARLFRVAVGDKFVFIDDNATCHRTLAVQDCLDSESIQRLERPARSPNQNPIENVWDALGRQVSGRNYPPTNKNTFIRALTEERDKLPQQLLDNVVQSMTCRVAGQVDRSECAVRNCWEQWTREGTLARKTGSGATRKTTRREDRRIVRQALVDPTVTLSTIRADVGVTIVPQTISRHLTEANLKSKRNFRALPLTPEHGQLRLQWCQARSMWNVTDWQKVVFSDESRFDLGTDDNRVRVWRRPGERGNFQQDNARLHTARVAQDFLRYFQTPPWPARSPDSSPIEHVWDQLKRQMSSCHSVHDLELAVQDLWVHLPQDNISCLINSMLDRVATCIAAGGGPMRC